MLNNNDKKSIKYVIYKEEDYFVAQCLNVDVSSFGESIEEAIRNIHEAVELYFDDELEKKNYTPIKEALIGDFSLNV